MSPATHWDSTAMPFWWMKVQRGIATEPMGAVLSNIFDSTDGANHEFTLKEQRRFHLEMWMLLGDPATRLL